MKIGMIGLGRMGANMAQRLMRGGHECVAYDRSQANVASVAKEGAADFFLHVEDSYLAAG